MSGTTDGAVGSAAASADDSTHAEHRSRWPIVAAGGAAALYAGVGLILVGLELVPDLLAGGLVAVGVAGLLGGLAGWADEAFLAGYPRGEADAGRRRIVYRSGMVAFLVSDVATFLAGFVYYAFVRVGAWPPADLPPVVSSLVLVNTGLLVASSVTLHLGHGALAAGDRGRFRTLLAVTVALGVTFLGGQALEITWTAATAVVLVFAGVSGYFVFASPYLTPTQAAAPGAVANGSGAVAGNGAGNGSGPEGGGEVPADAVAVEVLAYQWGWQVTYPAANVTTQNRLVVPTDRDVFVRLTASDVVHSLYVPALGIKQDAFPGQETLVRTRVTEPGRYRFYCTELCGAGHARMQGTVVALNASAYEAWLADRGVPADGTTASVAGDGEGAAASSIPPGSSMPAGHGSRPATPGAVGPATPGPVAG